MNRENHGFPKTLVLLVLWCVSWGLVGCQTPVTPDPPSATAEIRVGSCRAAYDNNRALRSCSGPKTSFKLYLDKREVTWSNYTRITLLNSSSIASGHAYEAEFTGFIDGHYFVSGTVDGRGEAKARVHFDHVGFGNGPSCSGTFSGMAFLDSLDEPVPLSGSFVGLPINDSGG